MSKTRIHGFQVVRDCTVPLGHATIQREIPGELIWIIRVNSNGALKWDNLSRFIETFERLDAQGDD